MEQQLGFCTTDDGVRIAYATYGGDGPPVFVLPDIVGQEAVWKHPAGRGLLEQLARGRRLITYDARFTGASERRGDSTSLACWVRDIEAVMNHLALDQVALISLGGITSPLILMYAANHPDRVSALAMWGAMFKKPRVPAETVETFSRMWAWNARALATVYFPSGPLEMQQWFSKSIASAQFHQTFGAIMALEWDLSATLPGIQTPTLIIQREETKSALPEWSRNAARLLPNARLSLLPGDEDHPVHWPDQYIATLDEFIAEHAPPPLPPTVPPNALTVREIEVLSLLAGGRTAKEIAVTIGVSPSTAQRHIANIYAKIGARGRVDAAAYALARGLVRPRDDA